MNLRSITALDVSPELGRHALGRRDGRCLLLDLHGGEVVAALPELLGPVTGVAFSGDALWCAAEEGRVAAWRADTGRPLHAGDAGLGPLAGLAPAGADRLVLLGAAGAPALWSGPERRPLRRLDEAPPGDWVALATGGGFLALADAAGRVVQGPWRGDRWAPAAPLGLEGEGAVTALAVAPDGSWLAAARGGEITLVDLRPGGTRTTLTLSYGARCRALGFSPAGTTLMAAADDGLLRAWRRGDAAWQFLLSFPPAGLTALDEPHDAACGALRVVQEDTVVAGHDDGGLRAARFSTPDFTYGAVVHIEDSGALSMSDFIGGRNPGMWSYLFPAPGAAEAMRRQSEAVVQAWADALARPEDEPPPPPVVTGPPPDPNIDRLYNPDPEVRHDAARALGETGDARALVPLERAALQDAGGFSVEGAFVDGYETVSVAALEALGRLYARLPLGPADLARLGGYLRAPGGDGTRTEELLARVGAPLRPLLDEALSDEDPALRLRARLLLLRLAGRPEEEVLADPDEELRLAATALDAYRNQWVVKALRRFPDEPSARVRRGILDLWLRYEQRMGGTLRGDTVLPFLLDADAELRGRAARHVAARLRTKRGERLDALQARLPELVARETDEAAREALRELEALLRRLQRGPDDGATSRRA